MLYEMGKVCQQNRQENANNLHKFKNDVPQKNHVKFRKVQVIYVKIEFSV